MRILVEVTGQSLSLRGPIVHVGERLWLETDDPAHREVLDASGWVRRVEGPALATLPGPAAAEDPDVATKVIAAPPVDRMMHAPAVAKGAVGKKLNRGR